MRRAYLQTARVVLFLMGLTGNVDVPGGNVFWVPPEGVLQQYLFVLSPVLHTDGFSDGMWRFHMRVAENNACGYPLARDVHRPSFWREMADGHHPEKVLLIDRAASKLFT